MLQGMVAKGATDILFSTGSPPMGRFGGRLRPISSDRFSNELLEKMVYALMNDEQRTKFEMTGELDLTVNISGVGRFRSNVFRQRGSVAVAFRPIVAKIPSLQEQGLPEAIAEILMGRDGLVLVTGPGDSGKTTTLASLVNHINENREGHVVTFEDPVEFIHETRKSLVDQREIGRDTASYASGLKMVRNQAPDVLLIDQLPDMETIAGALRLAESGNLVLSSLPTRSATQAVDRLINVFPPYQQQQIRTQVAMTLRAVLAQQLVPGTDGKSRVLAREVLLVNKSIRQLILDEKVHLIPNAINSAVHTGMISMDASLRKLRDEGAISLDSAVARASDPSSMSSAARTEGDLGTLEKALYDQNIQVRKKAEAQLQLMAGQGNEAAQEVLNQFAQFYQTNFEEKKLGVRR